MFGALSLVALLIAAAAATPADRQQPRDAGPGAASAAGRATIAGAVVTDEAQPKPLRRARVTLNGSPLRIGRTAITADDGTFTFDRLPAGRYTLSATKEAYVEMSYGARRPGRPGAGVEVRNAEARAITIRIARGAVITGTVTNADGQPAAGILVDALMLRYMFATGERRLAPAGVMTAFTDDRGVYRIFGLAAGEYVIGAQMDRFGGTFGGELVMLSDAEIRRALADVRGSPGQSGRSTAPVPEPAVTAEARRTVGLSAVYYPGTLDAARARTVIVGAAEERGGIDFQLQHVPTTTVDGTVFSSGAGFQRSFITLVPSSPTVAFEQVRGAVAGPDGRFTLRGVAPGSFTLVARTVPPRPGAGAPDSSTAAWASTDIVVDGQDVIDVSLTLQPGLTISGRVDYEGVKPPPAEIPGLRFGLNLPLTLATDGPASLPPVRMEAGGRFTLSGIIPGSYRPGSVQGQRSPIGGWWLKSIVVNGRDLLDSPLEFRHSMDDVLVTFADDATELSGRVIDSTASPAPAPVVIVFSVDSASWFFHSRRVAGIRPDADGRYRIRNLPRGEYYVAALDDVEEGEWYDPSVLQRLTGAAARIALAEREKKSHDVVVSGR